MSGPMCGKNIISRIHRTKAPATTRSFRLPLRYSPQPHSSWLSCLNMDHMLAAFTSRFPCGHHSLCFQFQSQRLQLRSQVPADLQVFHQVLYCLRPHLITPNGDGLLKVAVSRPLRAPLALQHHLYRRPLVLLTGWQRLPGHPQIKLTGRQGLQG